MDSRGLSVVSTKYVHKISRVELTKLLRVKDRDLDKLTRRRGLPAPIGTDEEGTWWSSEAIRGWLADADYLPARELLIEWWPEASEPATYLGARPLYRARALHPLMGGPVAVLQRWAVESGEVVVVWDTTGHRVRGAELAEWVGDVDAVVVVGWDWGLYGPSLWARTGSEPQTEGTEIEWPRLARVLGRPAPFWPGRLRHADLILRWSRATRRSGTWVSSTSTSRR